MILAFFYIQVTPMLPTKFQINWPFCSAEEAKHRFSRWRPWHPYWISNRNDFIYVWSTSHPDASIKFQVIARLVQEKKRKIDFQDSHQGSHLGFLNRMTPGQPSWISEQNDFSYFKSTSHPNASYQFSSKLVFWFRRRSEKYIFQ